MIFIDPGHLSGAVFAEYIRQILPLAGIKENSSEHIDRLCFGALSLNMPVYGCVRGALQIGWVNEANKHIKSNTWTLDGTDLGSFRICKTIQLHLC